MGLPSLSFLVLLCVWLRSYGHFTSPTPSASPRGIFNKTALPPSLSTKTSRPTFPRPPPSDLASDFVLCVAMSTGTAAVLPFRSFIQTPIFSGSPSSCSLSPIW